MIVGITLLVVVHLDLPSAQGGVLRGGIWCHVILDRRKDRVHAKTFDTHVTRTNDVFFDDLRRAGTEQRDRGLAEHSERGHFE